jgi:hypothetical protein
VAISAILPVQGDAADELHVERDHLPFQRMSAHGDFLAAQAAAGVFDHGKGFGQNFVGNGSASGHNSRSCTHQSAYHQIIK